MHVPTFRKFDRRSFLKGSAVGLPAAAGLVWSLDARERFAGQPEPVAAQVDDTATLVEGNTAFALDLYSLIRTGSAENLLISPYSISQVLAMTYAGAGGETAAQMAGTLRFTLPPPVLHEAFRILNADLVGRGNADASWVLDSSGQLLLNGTPCGGERGCPLQGDLNSTARRLGFANALWGEQTFPFSQGYSELLKRHYDAELHQSDFLNAPQEVRTEINDWVAERTEGRIENIVPENAITPGTRLVLANAVHFYGSWSSQFRREKTENDTFYLVNGSSVTIPFMFQQGHVGFGRGQGYQTIEIDYADGSGFAFTIILPDTGAFEAFEAHLDSATLAEAIGTLVPGYLRLYLPKFSLEFATSLAPVLQEMGMLNACDPKLADFSGMVDSTPPEPLWINMVLHKAFIAVDEYGTEAAAATVGGTVGGGPVEPPPEVRVDRPFIFAIRDTQTGSVLFLGRVMHPGG